MRHKALLLIYVLAIALSPLAIWCLVGIVGRAQKASLRGILPWLRALRWIAWAVAIILVFFALVRDQRLWLVPFAAVTFGASAGLGIVERWVKRRYAPDLLPSD